jgi:hypothetical protein
VKVLFGKSSILHPGIVRLSPKYSPHMRSGKFKNIITYLHFGKLESGADHGYEAISHLDIPALELARMEVGAN